MRHLQLIILLTIFQNVSSAQSDTVSTYQKLDTLKTYNVSLTSETGPSYARYFINGRKIDKRTYDYYKDIWDNIGKCTPCVLYSYSEDEVLERISVQFTDCAIGQWKEYYSSGQIKIIGHFKENTTGDWTNLYKRGFCSVRHGKWTYFDISGRVTKTEIYKDNKLIE